MKKQTKRGFTIVELVIVIAIIAILAAILIPTFSNVIKRANISRDTQLIRNLNTALVVDSAKNGTHTTMQSALDAAEKFGYDVSKINKSATDNEILWDSVNDVFCYFNADSTEENKIEYIPEFPGAKDANPVDYFVISNEIDDTYSTYLFGYEGDSAVTITKGLDVGNTTTINSISYTNTDTAQNVVIRTNSANTTLTINAEHDTVNHYGKVGKVDAQKIGMDCYNEYGTAAYVKVTEGKVVAKAGGSIAVVFAANNDKDAVAVIKETNGTIERGLTVIEPVSTTNEARTNGIPLEYSVDGETAATKTTEQLVNELETREATVEVIAVDVIETAVEKEAIEADESDFWIVCHADEFASGSGTEQDPYIIKTARQLSLLAYNVNTLKAGYASAYYKLEKDIDLSGKAWTPIGTTNDATTVFFTGHFDGNGKSIYGLTNDGKSDADLGLFSDELSSVEGLAASYGLFGFTQNVNILDLTMESASIDGSYFKEAGIIIGMATGSTTMTNCIVDSNSSISGLSKIGGIIGFINLGTGDNGLGGNVNLINCDFAGEVTVSADRAGAIIGAFCANQSTEGYNLGHTHLLKDCDSTGTINSGSYGTGLIGFFYQGSAVNTYGIKTITFDNCTANVTKFATTENNAKYIGRLDSYTTALIIKNDSYATNIIGDLHSGASLILKVENNIYGYQNNGGNDLLPSLTGNEETYKLGQMITNAPSGSWHEYWKTDRIGELVQKDTLFKIDPSSIDLSTGELKYGAGWYDTHISDFSFYVADGYHVVIPDTHSVLETVDKDNNTIYHYIYQVVAD